ncbi:MAG: toxic anion resistance protein [Alphaproteobacteria bacterium]|nr:toxic anion resistance protein [Alphaproteobacteria bacterium]
MTSRANITAAPVQLTPQALAPSVDEDAARALAATIDVQSPLSVAQFGQHIGITTAGYADTLLAQARADDLDEVGSKLSEVMIAAQSFDLTSLDNGWHRVPVLGPVARYFSLSKEKAMTRFKSVETQIGKIVGNIDGALDRLTNRAEMFEAMYAGVTEEHGVLATHVRAGELRMADLDQEIEALRQQPPSLATSESINRLEMSRQALSKRIGDLSVLQHSALQTLPMIRLMQANNVVLLEKFQTIERLTLPAWKRTFVMALALNEQRDAVKLADDIDDATNYFMKRNSEILHENAVATARASQRQVIDIETLRAVHENVIKTLADVQSAYSDGAEKRNSALAELAKLRDDMAAGLCGTKQPLLEKHTGE